MLHCSGPGPMMISGSTGPERGACKKWCLARMKEPFRTFSFWNRRSSLIIIQIDVVQMKPSSQASGSGGVRVSAPPAVITYKFTLCTRQDKLCTSEVGFPSQFLGKFWHWRKWRAKWTFFVGFLAQKNLHFKLPPLWDHGKIAILCCWKVAVENHTILQNAIASMNMNMAVK